MLSLHTKDSLLYTSNNATKCLGIDASVASSRAVIYKALILRETFYATSSLLLYTFIEDEHIYMLIAWNIEIKQGRMSFW